MRKPVASNLNQQYILSNHQEQSAPLDNFVSEYSFIGVQRDSNYDMYIHEFLELSDEEEALLAGESYQVQVPSSSIRSEVVCDTCTIKFDSACSRCMSGIPNRLFNKSKPMSDIVVKGFNGAISSVDSVGVNDDGKKEYYIQSMPSDLCLLSANEYAKDGAAILMEKDGVVLQLSNEEKEQFRAYIAQYKQIKELVVRNRTYEVANYSSTSTEVAMSNSASRYFNSKVNVSNSEERILATLLTGLSFRDLYQMAKHENVLGLPRDITIQSLNSFQYKYGSTPDVLQLAVPNLAGNTKGYMAPVKEVTTVGERVEADYMQFDFNDTVVDEKSKQKKTVKLPSHGGATGAYLSVDVYSGMVHGRLVSSVSDSVSRVKETVEKYKLDGYAIQLFAADMGVLIQGKFSVATPEVQEYLRNICKIECSEPYQHNYGTSHIERTIRSVSELVRFAMLYVLNNPNLQFMGFTKTQLLKLWGELFSWALTIINLKPCVNFPSKTKYEVYHNRQPDLRNIRLLPIFAVLYVLRRKGQNDLDSNRDFWQRGFYIGPSSVVPGAVRVAVLTRKRLVEIITSSEIKGVSDGGDLNIYPTIASAVNKILQKEKEDHQKDDHEIQPEHDQSIENNVQQQPEYATQQQEVQKQSKSISIVQEAAVPPKTDESIIVPDRGDGFEIVSEVLGHKGSAKKKAKMKFKVRWKNFDDSHDSWLPWKDLRGNALLHLYLQRHGMERLVPPEYRSAPLMNETTLSVPPLVTEAVAQEVPQQVKFRSSTSTSRRKKSKSIEAMAVWELLKHVNSHLHVEEEESNFVDWSTHDDESYYYSFIYNAYMVIEGSYVIKDDDLECSSEEELCLRAVTENVPKNFTAALHDPLWGDAARKELHTVTEATGAMVKIDPIIAKDHIRQGADVLRMISVYEEKVKEGQLVRKVRLVADGRYHKNHGPTYSPTPSREELLILLHICAARGWDYWHVDEIRAFLNAPKQTPKKVYAKISGDGSYWEIVKAVYGLKDAARDYHDAVEDRLLNKLHFTKLQLCASVYVKHVSPSDTVIVYDYVDDFIFTGAVPSSVSNAIAEFREFAATTEPILNAELLLGMEVHRIKDRNLIQLTMKRQIEDLMSKYPNAVKNKRNVPMPRNGYVLRPQEFESLATSKQRVLTKTEIEVYMSIVGSLLWIQGVRMDIIFAVLYLTWNAKSPTQHHLDMAYYVIGYLSFGHWHIKR